MPKQLLTILLSWVEVLSMGNLYGFTCGTAAVICADVKTSVTVRVCVHVKSLSDSVCVCDCVCDCAY